MTAPRRLAVLLTCVVPLVGACSDDGAERSVEAFCDSARRLGDIESLIASLDPEALADAADELGQLASAAPDAVRSDAERVHATVASLANAVEAHPDDPEGAVEEALRAEAGGAAGVTSAGEAVERYAVETCDLDLTPTSGSTTSAVPGVTEPVTGLD